jgi:hypothetical protein
MNGWVEDLPKEENPRLYHNPFTDDQKGTSAGCLFTATRLNQAHQLTPMHHVNSQDYKVISWRRY